IAFLYWCKNPRLAIRLALLMGISGALASALKIFFHLPRPYWVIPGVRALAGHSSFAFPSGHSLGAVTFWGLLTTGTRHRWFTLFAAFLVASVGASRIFLGAHFPSDVIAGFGFGLFILIGFLTLEGAVGRRVIAFPLSWQILLAFAGSIVLALASFAALAVIGDWQVPAAWAEAAIQQGGQPIDPLGLGDAMTAAGFFFGFAAGAAVAWPRRMGVCAAGGWADRMLCFIPGLAVAWVIWFVIGLAIPVEPGLVVYPLQYLRAAVVAAWVSYGAPVIFART
ncbi:MAG: phosphatase PAP2 family protein, partial [Methanomicrobiales archaeon]|nr:phosphatase PAP2 family protein [Methanomicrobiales archaeon]